MNKYHSSNTGCFICIVHMCIVYVHERREGERKRVANKIHNMYNRHTKSERETKSVRVREARVGEARVSEAKSERGNE